MTETDRPLRPIEFQILLVLADGDAHGYGIMQEIRRRTDDTLRPEPGTLYRALRRLEEWDYVRPGAPAAEAADDERRRYYGLTGAGRRAAGREATRLAALVDQARASHLLGSG